MGVGSGRLDQLTGLRYFAALLVFLSHVTWTGTDPTLVAVFRSGYVGVSFFFVLSGFVLAHSYGQRIASGALGFGRYVLLRLARLTPLHFATAIPFIALALHRSEFHPLTALLNLLYLQSWVPDSTVYFSLNKPSWSLSDEMFFYVCFFPLVFVPVRRLARLGLALLVVVVLAATYVETQLPGRILAGENSFGHWLFDVFPGFRLLEFIVGMLLHAAWTRRVALPAWTVPLAWVVLFAAMALADRVPESFRLSLYFLPCIVLFFYSHLDVANASSRFFASRPLVLLGNASFAFYLVHQPLIGILTRVLAGRGLGNGMFCAIALAVATTLSIVTYLVYERPAERYLKSRIGQRPSVTGAVAEVLP
jgi:peptidoglycan/LPS O-acetylase OafA/YrhL